ncbi:DUF6520 family protein [Mucilaginibacter sp. SJ]|uniref:DUF6520 family protein n=1 Tax=Mucilaginibacter sp. SJ TaxID=3029053 RepID=UPI0023A94DF8|nr:DUF6520 family protein [Mucilaginibacter sp. SJ]WEA00728.1 DUF6520 family protein [Mucilaginibacter sp. SJ]
MKLNFAAIAVLLGTGAAFATSAKPADVKWRQLSNGSYQQVTAAYTCSGATGICTVSYPTGQDPNIDNSNPVSQEAGTFH